MSVKVESVTESNPVLTPAIYAIAPESEPLINEVVDVLIVRSPSIILYMQDEVHSIFV